MTLDLGAHAGAVLAAYGVALGLLVALVAVSALRAVHVRRALLRLERPAHEARDGRA